MRRAAILTALIVASGCGDTRQSPSGPTTIPLPQLPAIRFVTIYGPNWLLLNRSEPARVIVSLEDGSLLEIEKCDYRSDAPEVVSISERGVVTARSPGRARITATVGNHQGSLQVRALPDYDGAWTGDYRVTHCEGLLSDFRTCGRIIGFPPIGRQMRAILEQREDRVTGTVMLDAGTAVAQAIPVDGVIRLSGALVLEGLVRGVDREGRETSAQILNWNTVVRSDRTMSGGFTTIVTNFSFSFQQRIRMENEISTMRR